MTDHEPLPPPEPEAPKAERPGLWPRALRSFALWRIAGAGVVAAAIAGVALLAWAVLYSDDGDQAAEFFARIEDAVSRDGEMLHTLAESYRGGDLTTLEWWTDAESGASRVHSVPVNPTDTGDGIPTEETSIVTADYIYIEDGPRIIKRYEATRCDGMSGWLSAFLACTVVADVATLATVNVGEWEGTKADVLTLNQDVSAAGEDTAESGPPLAYSFFYRLYVGRDDYLPLAVLWEFTADDGTPAELVWQLITFSHEFIERTPENLALVDVRAFGYGIESTEALNTLAASMPVYWLGRGYEADEQIVSIVLYLAKPEPAPGRALSLHYETPSGSDALSVNIWRPDAWDAEAREPLLDSACVSVSEEELGGYTFTAYEMPPVNYPLPYPGESVEGDCLLETLGIGGMGDSGLLLAWEDDDVVVVIKSGPTGFFRYGNSLRETVAAAFQPYEPD